MLSAISSMLMIPVDQVNFIVAQLLALLLAWLYRRQYGHVDQLQSSSRVLRLAVLTLTGLWLSWFLLGSQVVHMINMTAGAYLLIIGLDETYQHVGVLIFSFIYLSYLHLDRLLNNYTVYSLDITAPMMIIMQKVTLVAFSLHDGHSHKYRQLAAKEDINTKEARRIFESKHHVILGELSALEYVAYIFNFPTVLCGPSIYFDDFIDFVDGRKLAQAKLKHYPSVKSSLLHGITVCNLCSLLIVLVASRFPVSSLSEQRFTEADFVTKLLFLVVVTSAARWKYYFAWSIAEAIGNLAGLGFDGVDAEGAGRWTLLNNVDIYGFENAISLRNAIESWNKSTDRWLRKLVYERTPKQWRLLATFTLSAVWHGFYPGYYLTFLTGALLTVAARNVRRYVRPYFVSDPSRAPVYHLLTYLSTRITIAYLVFPFVLLEWRASVAIYAQLGWFLHILAVFACLVLPRLYDSTRRRGVETRPLMETIPVVEYLGKPLRQSMDIPAASGF